MKILILVLSYKDNDIYSKFHKTQKETWDSVNVSEIKTYYYFGNNNIDEIYDNEILLNIPDGVSLINYTNKMIKAFEMIKGFNVDYIFRTSSSSYIDKKRLLKYIEDKPKNNFYSGFIGTYNNINFASGSGFFLSKDLFNLILNNKDKLNYELYDDVSVGDFLKNINIEIINNKRYDILNESLDIEKINNKEFLEYFHYRFKIMANRDIDIINMKKIYKLKENGT
jgi:hypothetical protein